MLRIAARIVIAVFLVAGAAHAALAEKRVALVIGIDRYDNLDSGKQLKKAVNDARAVAAALKALGFDAELGENPTRREFFRLWTRFTERLSPGDVAAFFFAGHGVDLDGNYLVPRDVQALEGETTLKADSINFRELLEDLRARRLQVSFEILDACRDNPFRDVKGRALGGARGLGRPENAEGNFIMYSAGERQTALDRLSEDDRDPNSIFTRSLLPLLAPQTGLSLDEIAKKVRAKVRELARGASHQQFPAYYNELTEDFYLSAAKPPEPQPSKAPADAARPDASEAAGAAWAEIKDLKDIAVFEAFKKQYGPSNALYDTLAAQKIAELKRSNSASKDDSASSSWWPWPSGRRPDPEKLQSEKPKEPQVAIVAPPKPSPAPQKAGQDGCDGLLVSVAADERPCIVPGSGESFKDCADCPEMVIAPAGSFTMGSPKDEPDRDDDEGPQHKVTISKPFAAGQLAITVAEYLACVGAGGCKPPTWQEPGSQYNVKTGTNDYYKELGSALTGERHPIVGVSWNDAKAYVAWLSKKTGKSYRLLSEAEREYVARAGTSTPYWWGSSIEPELANYSGEAGKTLPVKSFKPNPWGLYQVHGNVYDWVEDCWHRTYSGAPTDGSAWTTENCSGRVLRGGSWVNGWRWLRAASRYRDGPGNRDNYYGFRLARTLNP